MPWHENVGLKVLDFINLNYFSSKVFEKVVRFKKFVIFVNWLFKSSSPVYHRKLLHPSFLAVVISYLFTLSLGLSYFKMTKMGLS